MKLESSTEWTAETGDDYLLGAIGYATGDGDLRTIEPSKPSQ
jgi:hypothetical protein